MDIQYIFRRNILGCLVGCLKESHKCRTVFRRVNGFSYVIAAIICLEGSLSHEPVDTWKGTESRSIFLLLKDIFEVLAAAMRFEPANAKHFNEEVSFASLARALRLLGCFTSHTEIEPCVALDFDAATYSNFEFICAKPVKEEETLDKLQARHDYCCMIIRFLYDLTIDNYKPKKQTVSNSSTEFNLHHDKDKETSSNSEPAKGQIPPSLNLHQPKLQEPKLVHPNAIITMLDLVPAVYDVTTPALSATLQLWVSELIKSLLRSEKNQQIMCDTRLPAQLLSLCGPIIDDENHFLHTPYRYLIERLAAQKLEPLHTRAFLQPNHDLSTSNSKSFVALARIKALHAMTAPTHLHKETLPPFIEFDMSTEGFGCLFIPSLAPQSATGAETGAGNRASISSQDNAVSGNLY